MQHSPKIVFMVYKSCGSNRGGVYRQFLLLRPGLPEMASHPQSDSVLTRRLNREGSRPSSGRSAYSDADGYSRRGELQGREQFGSDGNLEDDVAYSIKSIERVVENFSLLKENFHFYKDLVADLRGKLDEEKAQREEFGREVVALERAMKAERERATRAETNVKASENIIRDLEGQLAALQSQTGRLVKAISLLVSAELEVQNDQSDGSLRLVS